MDSDDDARRRSAGPDRPAPSDGGAFEPERPETPGALDPEATGRVRAELARLATDTDSAPQVPAAVTARIGAALRAAPPPTGDRSGRPGPAHAVRSPLPPLRRVTLVVGVTAALLAAGLGAVMLLARPGTPAPGPAASPELTANRITATTARPPIGVPDDELRELLTVPPRLGPLAEPDRRTGCLRALGYTDPDALLGARPHSVDGDPGVLLLLPGTTAGLIVAVVVAPDCGPDGPAIRTERHVFQR
ncbi:hypothetical protein ABQE48_07955 [Mycolicibacterium thermoresistibile]